MLAMLEKILKRTARRIPIPRYGIPDAQRVLVLAPHMDDEILGCGGLLKLLSTREKAGITVVYVTDGCRGGADRSADKKTGELRKKEAGRALDRLIGRSLRDMIFLDIEDEEVNRHVMDKAVVERLGGILAGGEFDCVLAPYVLDIHPDHRGTCYLLGNALRDREIGRPPRFFFYEVWTPLIPNYEVDITGCFRDKLEALAMHKSQLKVKRYDRIIAALNAYRAGFAGRPEIAYAEAFYRCSLEEYMQLTDEAKERLPDGS